MRSARGSGGFTNQPKFELDNLAAVRGQSGFLNGPKRPASSPAS